MQFTEGSPEIPNRVTMTNFTVPDIRQLRVSMTKKYLTESLAMFENAGTNSEQEEDM